MSSNEQLSSGAPYKKYFFWFFIFILLIVIFNTGIQYQKLQTLQLAKAASDMTLRAQNVTNPKVNWKIYRDGVRGFSVQYPSNWFVSANSNPTQLEIQKKGSPLTHIAFLFPNNPESNHVYPKSTVSQDIQIGSESAAFDENFTGLGQPTSAHANVRALKIGKTVNDIEISLDINNTGITTATVKKILASFKTVN